jgi:ferric-chelate reductase
MKRPHQIFTLLVILIASAGLTIGLTYAPCFASLCSESYLPYETRIHMITYYSMLASTGSLLFLRATSTKAREASQFYLVQRQVPILGKRVSLGGVALSVWLVGLILATTGFWVEPLLQYWAIRTDPLEWATAKLRLAVTGIIGHHADLLLGLVIIPVSRNSLLGRAFELHQSTLLYAHKLLAYLLFVVAFAHGVAYYVSDETSLFYICYHH